MFDFVKSVEWTDLELLVILICPLGAEGVDLLTPSRNTGLQLAASGPVIIATVCPVEGAPPRHLVKAIGALNRKIEEHGSTLLALVFPILPTGQEFPPALMRRVQQMAQTLQRQGGLLVVAGPVQELEKHLEGGVPVCLVGSEEEALRLLSRIAQESTGGWSPSPISREASRASSSTSGSSGELRN